MDQSIAGSAVALDQLLGSLTQLRKALAEGHDSTSYLESELEKLGFRRESAERELRESMVLARERAVFLEAEITTLAAHRATSERELRAAVAASRERLAHLESELDKLDAMNTRMEADLEGAMVLALDRYRHLESALQQLAAHGGPPERGEFPPLVARTAAAAVSSEPDSTTAASVPPPRNTPDSAASAVGPPAPAEDRALSSLMDRILAEPELESLLLSIAARLKQLPTAGPRNVGLSETEGTTGDAMSAPTPAPGPTGAGASIPSSAPLRMESGGATRPTPTPAPSDRPPYIDRAEVAPHEDAGAEDRLSFNPEAPVVSPAGAVAPATPNRSIIDAAARADTPGSEAPAAAPDRTAGDVLRPAAAPQAESAEPAGSEPPIREAINRNPQLVVSLVLGKYTSGDIIDATGARLVRGGTKITNRIIDIARDADRLYDLWVAAQPSPPSGAAP